MSNSFPSSLFVQPHVLDFVATVFVVVVHHVAQEALKMVKAAIVRSAGLLQPPNANSHDRGMVTGSLQYLRKQYRVGWQIPPVVIGVRTNDANRFEFSSMLISDPSGYSGPSPTISLESTTDC